MAKLITTLFLLEDLCYGGTQKQLIELALRLDKNIFQPQFLTLSGPGDLDRRLKKNNVPIHYMGKKRGADSLFFARLPGRLKQLKPDVLIPGTAMPNIWGRIWGRFLHIPVIIGTCRGGGAPGRQHEWLLWRAAHHIICNSPALIEVLEKRGIPRHHLSLISNGVDTELFYPPADKTGSPLIICVARLAQDKDHQTLLRAFARLWRKMPQVRLRIVGDGPEKSRLVDFCSASLPAQALQNIEFTGSSDNPAKHYREADIFALTSIREAQPNVIIEAMASGLPVCATNVGGIPFLVRDGENGLLAEAGDDAACAANLERLLLNPQERLRLGCAGRARAESEFSFKSMVQKHQDIILSLLERAYV